MTYYFAKTLNVGFEDAVRLTTESPFGKSRMSVSA